MITYNIFYEEKYTVPVKYEFVLLLGIPSTWSCWFLRCSLLFCRLLLLPATLVRLGRLAQHL